MSEYVFPPIERGKIGILPGTPGETKESIRFISLPKTKIGEWTVRYEIAARYLCSHIPPERVASQEERDIYMSVLEEHQEVKRYLYRSGHKKIVMRIDEELAEVQRNMAKLQWGRDEL